MKQTGHFGILTFCLTVLLCPRQILFETFTTVVFFSKSPARTYSVRACRRIDAET